MTAPALLVLMEVIMVLEIFLAVPQLVIVTPPIVVLLLLIGFGSFTEFKVVAWKSHRTPCTWDA